MIDYGYKVCLGDIPDQARDWRNHPMVRDWCRESDFITDEQHRAWLDSLKDNPSVRMYGIWTLGKVKSVDKHGMAKVLDKFIPIGVCGLTGIRQPHMSGEWSLYITPEQRGYGYATEALRCLMHHGFYGLGLNRIWGEIFETNEACLKLADKVGFQREGKLRSTYYKNGSWLDSVIVSILKSEWEAGTTKTHSEAGGI